MKFTAPFPAIWVAIFLDEKGVEQVVALPDLPEGATSRADAERALRAGVHKHPAMTMNPNEVQFLTRAAQNLATLTGVRVEILKFSKRESVEILRPQQLHG